jgi:hypothetical protein
MEHEYDRPIGETETIVQIGTPEDRATTFLESVRLAAKHHGTVADAIKCATSVAVNNLIADLVIRASGAKTPEDVNMCHAFIDCLVADASINVAMLQLLGHVGDIGRMIIDGQPLPEEYALIRCGA